MPVNNSILASLTEYNWQDYLVPASFRGVFFYCEVHGIQGGRRTVTHEFPVRDVPYTEDLGRRAQKYVTTAYVIGDAYTSARDQLIAACETLGPGTLQFPTLGPFQALCESYNSTEHRERGRIATIEMVFVEAGALDGFGVALNTVVNTLTQAQSLGQTSASSLNAAVAANGGGSTSGTTGSSTNLPVGYITA